MFQAAGVPLRSFKAGEAIFREGDPAKELYCIQSGSVGVYIHDRLAHTVEANGVFGIMSLIEHGPRGDTAIAETDVTLAAVSEKTFLFCVSETPYFALNVMRALARQLRADVAASPRAARTVAIEDATIDFSSFRKGGAPLRSFKAGDAIFLGGDAATELYCVQSGRVRLDLGDGRIRTIGPSGIFGIMSLIEHGLRGETAIAETDVTLAAVSEKTFLFCVSETPYFSPSTSCGLWRAGRVPR